MVYLYRKLGSGELVWSTVEYEERYVRKFNMCFIGKASDALADLVVRKYRFLTL